MPAAKRAQASRGAPAGIADARLVQQARGEVRAGGHHVVFTAISMQRWGAAWHPTVFAPATLCVKVVSPDQFAEVWQAGLSRPFTLPEEVPPLRLLLVWDNLTGHKTPELVLEAVE